MLSQTLNEFAAASSIKIIIDKSKVMGPSNISRRKKEKFTTISSIQFTANLGKYLGFPLLTKE